MNRVYRNGTAMREANKMIKMHNASSSAADSSIKWTLPKKRLRKAGVGFFWGLDNDNVVIELVYTARHRAHQQPGVAILSQDDKMTERFNIPTKMDSGKMSVTVFGTTDVRSIVESGDRGTGLHVWLPKNMFMCERLRTLARVFSGIKMDTIAVLWPL